MRPLMAALLVVVTLSGCLGGRGGDDSTPTVTGQTSGTPTATLDVSTPRPEWSLGLQWTYNVELVGLPISAFKMMVAQDAEDLWIVGTDDRAGALNHALYSTNPVLGRIAKDTLSPFQSGEPVRMFEFPLSDRKEWSATFFDETMTFRATFDDAVPTLPDVYLPGYRIVATGRSGARVEYNYVDAVKWFTDFQYFDAAGTKQIHLSLESFGDDYRGSYFFMRGRDKLADDRDASTIGGDPVTFQVEDDDGLDALGVGLIATATGQQLAVVNVTLKGPDGAVRYSHEFRLAQGQLDRLQAEIATATGAWSLDVLIVGPAKAETRVTGLILFSGALA